MYLGKTLYSYSASCHLRVYISIGELLRESGEVAGKGGGEDLANYELASQQRAVKQMSFRNRLLDGNTTKFLNKDILGTSESSFKHHVTFSHLMAPLLNPVAITLTEIPSGAAENSRQLIMCSHVTCPMNLPLTVHIFITLPSSTVLSSEM